MRVKGLMCVDEAEAKHGEDVFVDASVGERVFQAHVVRDEA